MGPKAGRVGLPPWSDLPLNRVLYIPFSIFAYSSNIFIASLDLMGSMLALGTLKNSRFFLSSSSLRDLPPAMTLICSTIHPGRYIVLLSANLRESYCSSATRLALTTYRLVTSNVGHALEFHLTDHARFGFRGHFECNAVRSFIP